MSPAGTLLAQRDCLEHLFPCLASGFPLSGWQAADDAQLAQASQAVSYITGHVKQAF